MSTKPVIEPGPDHPITVEPTAARVTVNRDGRTIADTEHALTLQEADYPAAQYIPFDAVDPAVLEATDHTTYCPYKGEANYYNLVIDGDVAENAVWQYSTPHPAMERITGHVAFYPDQVTITTG